MCQTVRVRELLSPPPADCPLQAATVPVAAAAAASPTNERLLNMVSPSSALCGVVVPVGGCGGCAVGRCAGCAVGGGGGRRAAPHRVCRAGLEALRSTCFAPLRFGNVRKPNSIRTVCLYA